MAGAGYKLFNTGDVLTAAQVNTYLNEQTVMVFASSAARTSALSGVLAEGMMSYLQDTNSVEVYNGTSWVNVGNAGDITEVQAGVGISIASGTGPIPVITNSSTDLITTAGDILYGTAADTMARLGIGTAGQVLKVNSGATAPEWGAAAGGMTLESTTTMTGGGITLDPLPTTYNHLQVVIRAYKPASDGGLYMRFNNDSGSNFRSDVSNDLSGSTFNASTMQVSNSQDSAGNNSLIIINIFDYRNTSTWKFSNYSSLTNNETTNTNLNYRFGFGAWNNTAAITRLDFFPGAGNFTSGSILLYGVK